MKVRKLSAREGALVAVLALSAALYLWYSAKSATPARLGARKAAAASTSDASPEPPVVRMDLLARPAEGYDGGGRDLFQYSQRPISAAEVRRLRAEAELRRKALEEAQRREQEEAERRRKEQEEAARVAALHPAPPPPPQPPAIHLRYLGFLGPKDDRIVIFEDGKELIVARKGDVVKDQFRVVEVKWESVVMGYVRPEFKGKTRELTMARK